MSVVVEAALAATFSAGQAKSSAPPDVGTSVPFTAIITGGVSPFNVTWSFGDGSLAYGSSVSHVYGRSGSFSINVSVVDFAGARVTDSLPLKVVASSGTSTSSSGNSSDDLALGIFFGLLIGATLALVVLYVAGRARRRPPAAPSPYVPPAAAGDSIWKED
jgi:hypothetical protein